jgi:hypothetical protein
MRSERRMNETTLATWLQVLIALFLSAIVLAWGGEKTGSQILALGKTLPNGEQESIKGWQTWSRDYGILAYLEYRSERGGPREDWSPSVHIKPLGFLGTLLLLFLIWVLLVLPHRRSQRAANCQPIEA